MMCIKYKNARTKKLKYCIHSGRLPHISLKKKTQQNKETNKYSEENPSLNFTSQKTDDFHKHQNLIYHISKKMYHKSTIKNTNGL